MHAPLRRTIPFWLCAWWTGCHVISGLDGLATGDDEGPSVASGVGAQAGNPPCPNDCCCPHIGGGCTGTALRYNDYADPPPGGAGGVGGVLIPVGAGGGGSMAIGAGGALTSVTTTAATGATTASTSGSGGNTTALTCVDCVCGDDNSCCSGPWSGRCVDIARVSCANVCACPL